MAPRSREFIDIESVTTLQGDLTGLNTGIGKKLSNNQGRTLAVRICSRNRDVRKRSNGKQGSNSGNLSRLSNWDQVICLTLLSPFFRVRLLQNR